MSILPYQARKHLQRAITCGLSSLIMMQCLRQAIRTGLCLACNSIPSNAPEIKYFSICRTFNRFIRCKPPYSSPIVWVQGPFSHFGSTIVHYVVAVYSCLCERTPLLAWGNKNCAEAKTFITAPSIAANKCTSTANAKRALPCMHQLNLCSEKVSQLTVNLFMEPS